jgi:hypothetical protein
MVMDDSKVKFLEDWFKVRRSDDSQTGLLR